MTIKYFGPRYARYAVIIALLAVCGCFYEEARPNVFIENACSKPNSHLFAVAVHHQILRQPKGLAAFPDGGVILIPEETGFIYLCDADTATAKRIYFVQRPPELKSNFGIWITRWDGEDLIFAVHGNKGNTSDTPFLRSYFRVTPDGKTEKMPKAILPPESSTPPGAVFVKISHDSSGVDVLTEKDSGYLRLFDVKSDGSLKKAHTGRSPEGKH